MPPPPIIPGARVRRSEPVAKGVVMPLRSDNASSESASSEQDEAGENEIKNRESTSSEQDEAGENEIKNRDTDETENDDDTNNEDDTKNNDEHNTKHDEDSTGQDDTGSQDNDDNEGDNNEGGDNEGDDIKIQDDNQCQNNSENDNDADAEREVIDNPALCASAAVRSPMLGGDADTDPSTTALNFGIFFFFQFYSMFICTLAPSTPSKRPIPDGGIKFYQILLYNSNFV
jgi:hypothetical protein